MTELTRFALAAGATLLGSAVNAIAGGGSLITFPALVAGGLSAVSASATNAVGMTPAFLGALLAQRRDLAGQRARLAMLVPAGAAGSMAGALLLLYTGEALFARIVPYLILFAALLLAVQDRLRRWLLAHVTDGHVEAWAIAPIGLASIYGGYFGAGVGVMMLAVLAVAIGDSLIRLNALKQAVLLTVSIAAAVTFVFSDQIDRPIAGVMLVASLAGGTLGGMIASRIPAAVLRWTVVALAVIVAVVYLAK